MAYLDWLSATAKRRLLTLANRRSLTMHAQSGLPILLTTMQYRMRTFLTFSSFG